MPEMTRRTFEGVARRLAAVFGPWSHVDESNVWDLQDGEISLVRVRGISGSIAVRGTSQDRASLRIRKVIRIPQAGAAEDFASKARVRFKWRGRALHVRVLHPRPPLGGRVFIHLALNVPHAVDVDLEASRGGIRVEGIEGAVQAHSRTGNIEVSDCLGSIILNAENGRVRVCDAEGGIDITCGRGAVRVEGVMGRVRAHVDRGGFSAEDVRGQVFARVRDGAATLRGGRGRVQLQTGSGDIEGTFDAGHREVRLITRMGKLALTLGAVEGNVDAESASGDIGLTLRPAFSGRLEAMTHRGELRAALAAGSPELLPDRLDAQVGSFRRAYVRLVSAGGDIMIGRVRESGEGEQA